MEASSSSGMLRRDPRRRVLETTTPLQLSFSSHHEQRRPGIYDLSYRALPDFPHGGQAVGALLSGESLVTGTCLEFCKHGLEIYGLVASGVMVRMITRPPGCKMRLTSVSV
jgi:hypothetical protein